jgi:Sec7-like guanine-nucleotide exchange factor
MEDNKKEDLFYKYTSELFDYTKKQISKSDEHFKELKVAHDNLIQIVKSNSNTTNNLKLKKDNFKYVFSDILLNTEVTNLKILDKIVTYWDKIIDGDILEIKFCDEGVKTLIKSIGNKTSVIINDDVLMFKILNFLYKIYETGKVSINSALLVSVITIFLKIFLSQRNPYQQNAAKVHLSKLIQLIINKIETSYQHFYNQIKKRKTKDLIGHDLIQEDDYKNYCISYLNQIVEVIEVNNSLNNCSSSNKNIKQNEFLKNYIDTCITSNTNNELYESLDSLNTSFMSKINDGSLGTHGKCVVCLKPSQFLSDKLMFAFCSSLCENYVMKSKNLLDYNFSDLTLHKEDFFITLKNLAKLSVKESKTPNSEMTGIKLREFCLETIDILLNQGSKYFIGDQKLILILKEHLINSLITNILSSEEKIFKLSVNLFLTLLSYFREHLKKEIYMFVSRVLIKILKSELLGFIHKETILDCFKRLSERSNFLIEIFANFDCDVNYENVFSDLLDVLTKIIQGMYKSSKYNVLIKPNQETVLKSKCMNIMNSFLSNLAIDVSNENSKFVNFSGVKISKLQTESVINIKDNSNSQNTNNNLNYTTNKKITDDIYVNNTNINHNNNNNETINIETYEDIQKEEEEVIDRMNLNLTIKNYYNTAVKKFNISHKKCQEYLISKELFVEEKMFNQVKDLVLSENHNKDENIDEENTSKMKNKKIENELNQMSGIALKTYTNLKEFTHEKLSEMTFNDYQSIELVNFIKANLKELNSNSIGELICGSKKFNISCLRNFIFSYNFSGLNIFEAMRVLFTDFKLVGEGQIVDRTIQFFGEKYTKDNPDVFPNPDCAYYLGFNIMLLQTDLHREEVTEKMSTTKFINQFNLLANGALSEEYLIDIYNRVNSNPIQIAGNKLGNVHNKNKKDLLKQEKDSIKSIFESINFKSNELYDFLININNEHVKNLISTYWTYFFSTFATILTETVDDTILIKFCCENLLNLAKVASFLKLETISEALLNALFQKTYLFEGKEITLKSFECIKHIIEFYAINGKYIIVGWSFVLNLISKIEYYHNLTSEYKNEQLLFSNEIRKRNKKNPEKEIEIELKNAEIISKAFSIIYCDNIFTSTALFSEEGIIAFLSALCEVSRNELSQYVNPRNYSLHKIIEVADYNLMRIQIQWAKIWKLISDHIIYVAKNYHTKSISIDAIDSLRQIVYKLLQKPDLVIYHFQIDFFRPFEIIFNIENLNIEKSELILNCLTYIVNSPQSMNSIHSGWIVIFNIIKVCFKSKESKLHDEGMKLLKLISDDFALLSNNQNNNHSSNEVFKGYIESLCHMYLHKNLKIIAFDNMLTVLNRIFIKSNQIITNNSQSKALNDNFSLTNKKYEFLKIFFYGIDDLLNVNVIEHLNLLFEIVSYNKEFFFSHEPSSFIFLFYMYFRPCILSSLISLQFKNERSRKESKDITDKEENLSLNSKNYSLSLEVKNALINSLSSNLESGNIHKLDFIEKNYNGGDNRIMIQNLLKQILKSYDQDIDLIQRKQNLLNKFSINENEEYLNMFIGKFFKLLNDCDENLYYTYFIEDSIKILLDFCNNEMLTENIFNIINEKLFETNNKNFVLSSNFSEEIMNILMKNIVSNITSLNISEENYLSLNISKNYKSYIIPISNFISNLFTKSIIKYEEVNINKFYTTINDLKTSINIVLLVQIKERKLLESEVLDILECNNLISKNLLKQHKSPVFSSNTNKEILGNIYVNTTEVYKKQDFINNINFVKSILVSLKDYIVNHKEKTTVIFDFMDIEFFSKISIFSKEFDNEICEIFFTIFVDESLIQNYKVSEMYFKCLKLMKENKLIILKQ